MGRSTKAKHGPPMSLAHLVPLDTSHPYRSLTILFILFKSLLLSFTLLAPGQGYDSSTSIFHSLPKERLSLAKHVISKLVHWDSVYFVHIASDGYVFEQDWAFGWGFTHLLRLLASLSIKVWPPDSYGPAEDALRSRIAIAGILISHLGHLASALTLHALTLEIFIILSDKRQRSRLALLSAAIHILCPAGIFLCAPYAEGPFAAISMGGLLMFSRAIGLQHGPNRASTFGAWWQWLFSTSIIFGVSTWFRGNGFFNGLVYICAILELGIDILYRWRAIGSQIFQDVKARQMVRQAVVHLVAGLLMGLVAAWPQIVAYKEFCSDLAQPTEARPWCKKSLPSIYSWVQSENWNVGFLRYWTISNIPLFLIASPMLSALIGSSLCVGNSGLRRPWSWMVLREFKLLMTAPSQQGRSLRYFAICQLSLALLALTTYHVQIVTRISSAYPVWTWWLAALMMREERSNCRKFALGAAQWMIMYAFVQAGLFASFLPPA